MGLHFNGGIGQGMEVIEEANLAVLFYRNDIEYLRIPRADPMAWSKWSNTADIGLVGQQAKVKTPLGVFFCSDDGVYLIDRSGSIQGPISGPIQDTYRTAVVASGTNFTAFYFPQQRQVLFGFGTTSECWVLDIDSISIFPRWHKYTWGDSRKISMGAVDENGLIHLFDKANEEIYQMGDSVTGTEAFASTFRSVYIRVGNMERLGLIRRMIVGHKGTLAVTPTIYLNNGASSQAKSAIAASANGEDRKVNLKRRSRNFAIQVASASSTAIVHEIQSVKVEVEDG